MQKQQREHGASNMLTSVSKSDLPFLIENGPPGSAFKGSKRPRPACDGRTDSCILSGALISGLFVASRLQSYACLESQSRPCIKFLPLLCFEDHSFNVSIVHSKVGF